MKSGAHEQGSRQVGNVAEDFTLGKYVLGGSFIGVRLCPLSCFFLCGGVFVVVCGFLQALCQMFDCELVWIDVLQHQVPNGRGAVDDRHADVVE